MKDRAMAVKEEPRDLRPQKVDRNHIHGARIRPVALQIALQSRCSRDKRGQVVLRMLLLAAECDQLRLFGTEVGEH